MLLEVLEARVAGQQDLVGAAEWGARYVLGCSTSREAGLVYSVLLMPKKALSSSAHLPSFLGSTAGCTGCGSM